MWTWARHGYEEWEYMPDTADYENAEGDDDEVPVAKMSTRKKDANSARIRQTVSNQLPKNYLTRNIGQKHTLGSKHHSICGTENQLRKSARTTLKKVPDGRPEMSVLIQYRLTNLLACVV
ncbi:unnamed protein product [Soboliphyme baturini]|uniref:40S ribosomal protein S30 n=1 Tax=Soboliphyme baturini TaxID=241478 RepID=A0A183J9R7_9BILA|nr:unnamed protein product [Soboliphyme baturini]